MRISDGMIDAAVKTLASIDDPFDWLSAEDQHDLMRKTLTAALAVQTQQGVEEDRTRNLMGLIKWAHETLYEINPSNYDHDEVCKLNDASVEVILGLAQALGEKHGYSADWWEQYRKDHPLPALVDVPAVESEPVALIEREVLSELQKHWNATGTVCSPLFKSKFGDKVALHAHPPLSTRKGSAGDGSATATTGGDHG